MFTLGLSSLFILIEDFKPINNDNLVSENNLTYSFYNHTTKTITHLDSGIPVYTNKKYLNKEE